jgi:hypothetical protein
MAQERGAFKEDIGAVGLGAAGGAAAAGMRRRLLPGI